MSNKIKTPETTDSGSDGKQEGADSSAELVEATQLQELPMVRTIKGLAASNNRAFGGEITSALIAGATTQLASELQYSKNENTKLKNKFDQTTELLTEFRIENAILKEKIQSFQLGRHLSNVGIFVGTGLFGIGLELVNNNYGSYGYVGVGTGILLILLGWFSTPKGVGK
tara:strand:- start:1982 stop:2491 length:510 start_codon:yes stop_codon:yes gene_type:complete